MNAYENMSIILRTPNLNKNAFKTRKIFDVVEY